MLTLGAQATTPRFAHSRTNASGPLPSRSVGLRCYAESRSAVQEAAPRSPGSSKDTASSAACLLKARQRAERALESYKYAKADDPPAQDTVASLRRKFEAARRELAAASESEYARLSSHDSSHSSTSTATITIPPPSPVAENLVRSIKQPAGPVTATVQHNIVPLPAITRKLLEKEPVRPEGTGEEVLLQGFNWDSWKHEGGFFNHVRSRAEEFAQLGFTAIWLPPFTQSVSEQGYMPGDLYNLNSKYGTEAELKECVRALQAAGLKVIGDAVLNHRCAQFQDEHGVWNKYGGKMDWDSRAIVGDDPNFRGRGNRSSGDHFAAAPNIDHSQDFVKKDIKEWLVWLRANVGFDGWRLDYVRGFAGSHVKDYMEASTPQFAVGEYWDALSYDWDGTPCHNQDAHRQRTVNWINAAGGLSTAFDITTKGILHAVFERCEYWRLRDETGKPAGLLGWWPSRSVTFLENHDTGSSQGHWRFPHHGVEQGYAYILTHPGSPCVFWDHLSDQRLKDTVGRLIAVRKRAGIHCRSKITILRADRDVYAAEIEGKDGCSLLMKMGPGDFAPDGGTWTIADCGHNWAVWECKQ